MSSGIHAATRKRIPLHKLTVDQERELLMDMSFGMRIWWDEQRKFQRVPGMVAAIAYGDEPLIHLASGATHLLNPIPVTSDTVFRLNSISKLHTAMIAMVLAADGQFDLNCKLGEVIPDAPPAVHGATMRQLLSHTADLHREGGADPWENFSRISLRELYEHTASVASPGEMETIGRYSNAGAMWVGQALQRITGKTYDELAYSYLIHPLGLLSQPDLNRSQAYGQLAQGHQPLVGNSPLAPTSHVSAGVAAPAYGWHGSVTDLLKIGMALPAMATEEVRNAFFEPVIKAADDDSLQKGECMGIGSGVMHYRFGDDDNQGRYLGHGGGGYGGSSLVISMPTPTPGWSKPFTVAIVGNSSFDIQSMASGLFAFIDRTREAGRFVPPSGVRGRGVQTDGLGNVLTVSGGDHAQLLIPVGDEIVVINPWEKAPIDCTRVIADEGNPQRITVIDGSAFGFRNDTGYIDPNTGDVVLTGNAFRSQKTRAAMINRNVDWPKGLARTREQQPQSRYEAGFPIPAGSLPDSDRFFTHCPDPLELNNFAGKPFTLREAPEVLELWRNANTPAEFMQLRKGMHELRRELMEQSAFVDYASRLYRNEEFGERTAETGIPSALLEAAAQYVVLRRILKPRSEFKDIIDRAVDDVQKLSSPVIHASRIAEAAERAGCQLTREL
jgi:CubicO group peptidase (beta-lactamase class C family)